MSGHRFSASDRDFALIEKQAKGAGMQTMDDVVKVIKNARPSKPFKVISMGEHAFFDFTTPATEMLNTTKLKISESSWLRITKDDIAKLLIKKTLSTMEPFKAIRILKPGYTIRDISLDLNALSEKIELNANKVKDLKAMLPYIDPRNHTTPL